MATPLRLATSNLTTPIKNLSVTCRYRIINPMDNDKGFKNAVTILSAAGLAILFVFLFAIVYH